MAEAGARNMCQKSMLDFSFPFSSAVCKILPTNLTLLVLSRPHISVSLPVSSRSLMPWTMPAPGQGIVRQYNHARRVAAEGQVNYCVKGVGGKGEYIIVPTLRHLISAKHQLDSLCEAPCNVGTRWTLAVLVKDRAICRSLDVT